MTWSKATAMLHGQETVALCDALYQGVDKRLGAKAEVTWRIAMRPGKRKALNKDNAGDALIDQAEKLKAGMRYRICGWCASN
jgi:transposase, IS5 family